jgi:Tfp pilus assembly protein PilF
MEAAEMGQHDSESCYRRGQLLLQRHRYTDAAEWFQRALGLDPNHAPSYAMLALSWSYDDVKKEQAVDAARRAVALEPETSFYRSVLAITQENKAKDGQNSLVRLALEEAKEGTKLDPDSDFAHSVEARLHLRLRDFPAAEAAARKALALNTENTTAAEVLSAALLLQKKDGDNASLVSYQLENNPESDAAHTSAGWLALSKGDHKTANTHFLEALRLNPLNERARLGLVESYRARSFAYNIFIRFCHFMSRFSEGAQRGIMLGGFVAYKVLYATLKTSAPTLASILVAVWLTLVFWSHLARGFSSFFMVFDRYARRSLKPREFWEGIAVGGVTVAAVGFLAASFAFGNKDYSLTAVTLFASSIVSAAAFTNDHYIGKWAYSLAAAVAGAAALFCLVAILTPISVSEDVFLTAFTGSLILGVAVSWLRALRIGYA